jgi:hypothetical protein
MVTGQIPKAEIRGPKEGRIPKPELMGNDTLLRFVAAKSGAKWFQINKPRNTPNTRKIVNFSFAYFVYFAVIPLLWSWLLQIRISVFGLLSGFGSSACGSRYGLA